MKKTMTLLIGTLLSFGTFSQGALGEVKGTVLEGDTEVSAFGAHVFIVSGGQQYNARTDDRGSFRISGIPAGKYVLNISYLEDTMTNIMVNVPMDGICQLGDIHFISDILTLVVMDAVYNKDALKMIDGDLPVTRLTAEEIARSPVKTDIKSLINSMSSDVRMTNDGELVFRGARKGDMLYLIDGVKTASVGNVPSASIGRMMIFTGGLPAKYGDTLGGVVVMETKSYFDLYRAWESEQIRLGKI